MKKSLLLATLLSLCIMQSSIAAAPKTWKVNLKDADITALISEVAEVTGKNFVIDSRVRGNITVISNTALNANQLYDLFLSVLNVNGFAAIPSGSSIKIVPDANAKQYALPVDVNFTEKGEALVTRVMILNNTNATELVPVLRPMMPQFAHLGAIPSSNALIFSDHANNIDALTQIVRQLDGDKTEEIESIALQNARVSDVFAMLDNLSGIPGLSSSSTNKNQEFFHVRVLIDSRSNRLLLKGSANGRKQIKNIIKTLDMPSEKFGGIKVVRLKHASAKQLAEILRNIMTGDGKTTNSSSTTTSPSSTSSTGISTSQLSLMADETLNALVIKADPIMMKDILDLIDQLDKRRTQVLIQAAIVEVSGDNAQQLGVQWAAGDPNKGVGIINFSNVGSSLTAVAAAALTNNPASANVGDGALLGFGKSTVDSSGNRNFYGALIQALSTTTNANLLSTPSIMTLDNQEAKIVVGQNVPFITGTSTSTASSTATPFQTIERQDVGITLKVIPHIGEDGTVRLEIEQEVSAVIPTSTGVKSADLITSKRSIKTTVLADNGQTIVLGGLVKDDTIKTISKVPLLGDIPLLGYLFRSTSDKKIKQNLLVFLQPTLVRDSTDAANMSKSQYSDIRMLDMSISKNGKITRLPESLEAIYQGYRPKVEPNAAPQPSKNEAPSQ